MRESGTKTRRNLIERVSCYGGGSSTSSSSASSSAFSSGGICFAECSRGNKARLATIQWASVDCRTGDFHRVCVCGKKLPSGIFICLDCQTRLRDQSKLCFPWCVHFDKGREDSDLK